MRATLARRGVESHSTREYGFVFREMRVSRRGSARFGDGKAMVRCGCGK